MARELIVLSTQRPEELDLLVALAAADPAAALSTLGAIVQQHAPGGGVSLAVDGPLLVQAPGEVLRLLGDDVRRGEPVWWTSIRCAASDEAADAAARLAAELAARTDGDVWLGFPA